MDVARQLFNRRWWWQTLLVLLGMAFLARLGFWQLDRLEQRREENRRIAAQLAAPPLELDGSVQWQDPLELQDRQVAVEGEFDYSRQIALKNQNWLGAPGVNLITPVRIAGSDRAVLVDRGWIPYQQSESEVWPQVDGPDQAQVLGYAQKTQLLPDGRSVTPDTPQSHWFRVDIAAIQAQLPYELLPFYIQQAPPSGNQSLPYREEKVFDLSEGNHMSYALQWFSFALIFGVGYLQFIRVNSREPTTLTGQEASIESDPSAIQSDVT